MPHIITHSRLFRPLNVLLEQPLQQRRFVVARLSVYARVHGSSTLLTSISLITMFAQAGAMATRFSTYQTPHSESGKYTTPSNSQPTPWASTLVVQCAYSFSSRKSLFQLFQLEQAQSAPHTPVHCDARLAHFLLCICRGTPIYSILQTTVRRASSWTSELDNVQSREE